MAKITITIEDVGDKVRVVSDPTFETMMMRHVSGNPFTAAHGYAFKALNAIREESRSRAPIGIYIPKLGKP